MAKTITAPIAIIGGGITGLALAALLEKSGKDYVLIEAQPELGGLVKAQQEHSVWLDYGLKSIPVGEDISENPLILLRETLNLDLKIESWTDSALTWGKTGFSAFMGFGETKARSLVEELNYYLAAPRLLVSGGWKVLIDLLVARIPEEKRLTRSIVTRIQTENERVRELVVNGETLVCAETYVFTLPPHLLPELLPPQALNPKLTQKMARTEPWTAVSIDLASEKRYSEAKNVFIFKDTVEPDFYVLGQFVSNADPLRSSGGLQQSTWLTLLHPEFMHDDENVSKTIKTMKKVLKKIFPELVEKPSWERLLVVPGALATYDQLHLQKNSSIPGFENLLLAGAQIKSRERNIGAALSSAFTLANTLTAEKKAKFSTESFSKKDDLEDDGLTVC